MMGRASRKEIVLAEAARHLMDEEVRNGFKGIDFMELVHHLQRVKTQLGFGPKENIIPAFLLLTMVSGEDAGFTIWNDIIRFKEEESEPRPRRRRNRRRA